VYVASNCAQAMRRQQLCDLLLQETREAKFSIDYGASTEAHAVRGSGGPALFRLTASYEVRSASETLKQLEERLDAAQ
jgi:hypothetical protein